MNPRFKVTGIPDAQAHKLIDWLKARPEYEAICIEVSERGIEMEFRVPKVYRWESDTSIIEASAFAGEVHITLTRKNGSRF